MMWFEALLSLKINLKKREHFPIGSIADVEALAKELGCKVVCLSSAYLGLPLGVHYNLVSAWDGVEPQSRVSKNDWQCGK